MVSSQLPNSGPAELDQALELARTGSTEGFTSLYRLLAGEIAGFCRARGVVDADDLVNDVFLGAFRRLANFDGDGKAFRAYAYRIARNKIIDDRQRRWRDGAGQALDDQLGGQRAAATVDDVESVVMERLDAESVKAMLGSITEDQREVILLRFLGELSISEVAAATDRTETAVKALQRRGLRGLRREISWPKEYRERLGRR